MATKDQIIAEIRRLASENGVPPGQQTFAEVTGIEISKRRGKFWRNWSAALVEAGLSPNVPLAPHDPEALVVALARLTLKLGHFPTYADLRLARVDDKSFPGHQSFDKALGDREQKIERVRDLAGRDDEYRELLSLLPSTVGPSSVGADDDGLVDGFVYLLKFGKHYKVGRTESVPTRHRQINLELPERAELIHKIATDDAAGIEAYWHRRFASKCTNGEWFALDRDDVRAFKRRKFM